MYYLILVIIIYFIFLLGSIPIISNNISCMIILTHVHIVWPSHNCHFQKAAVKIQAGVRGYLVRRLLRTNKVIDLKKIICDSVVCAKKLHMEQSVTQADVTLHVRLIRQVDVLNCIHSFSKLLISHNLS